MKKFFLLPLLAFTLLSTSSCVEEESDSDGEKIIDVDVLEEGVLGTWIYNPEDEPTVLSYIWIIEPTQSRIAKICDFGAGRVTAGFIAKSSVLNNIITIEESKAATVASCSISVAENSNYALNLVSENILRITHAGITTQYSRAAPID